MRGAPRASRRGASRAAAIIAGCLGAPLGLAAQPSDASRRPDAARRTVATFDFEEFATNPELVPMGWRVGQDGPGRERPGFPIFNTPELDYDVAFAGQGSVRLPIRGGSTSLYVETGVIPVFPDADYRVSAMVRTEGLRAARAFVEASLLDARGQVIEASRRRSQPVHTGGPWAEASVTLWGEWPEAAFVRIELIVLQAAEYQPGSPGYGRVWPVDVSGAAWFDDVRVIQQPRITLATGAPGNLVTRPATPSIEILARDVAGETLEAICRVYDVSGRVVATTGRSISEGRWQETWTPALTDLGWYRAVVEVRASGRRIGHGVLDFAWVPAEPSGAIRAGGFGAALTGAGATPSQELALAMQAAGLEHLTTPIWRSDLTAQTMDALVAGLGELLGSLRTLRGRVTLALPTVPKELAELLGIREDRVTRALAADPAAWGPYLDPVLDHYGQSVSRWQVGQVGDESASGSASLAEELAAFESGLARLVPGPIAVVPWRADRIAPPSATGDRVEYSVMIPSSVAPEGVEHVVRTWLGDAPAGTSGSTTPVRAASFLMEPFDIELFGARAAVSDLVKRAVFAWRGSGIDDPRLALIDPWLGDGHARSPLVPRPELAAWRNLRDRLRGREIVGELPMVPGTRCFILAPREGRPGAGALVAWNEWADPADARLEAMLTLGPVRVLDVFGNERRVEPITELRGELPARHHRIELTDMPVFVEGIDVALARLQASFRIEPGMVRAESSPRDLELVLRNPWPTPLSGRAFIVEPGGTVQDGTRDRSWRIDPRSFSFEAAPGAEVRMPVSLLMREYEASGPKRWIVDLRLAGREDLGWITVSAPLEVGLEGVDLRISTRVHGPDVEVEITIANTRAEPVDLDATVFAPGFPRERRSIGQIMPRTQVTRRFVYEDGARPLAGQTIIASVRESDSGARLNSTALVP